MQPISFLEEPNFLGQNPTSCLADKLLQYLFAWCAQISLSNFRIGDSETADLKEHKATSLSMCVLTYFSKACRGIRFFLVFFFLRYFY